MNIRVERTINDLESAERTLQRLQEELPMAYTLVGDTVFYGQIRAQLNVLLGELKGREKARENLWEQGKDVAEFLTEQKRIMGEKEDILLERTSSTVGRKRQC